MNFEGRVMIISIFFHWLSPAFHCRVIGKKGWCKKLPFMASVLMVRGNWRVRLSPAFHCRVFGKKFPRG